MWRSVSAADEKCPRAVVELINFIFLRICTSSVASVYYQLSAKTNQFPSSAQHFPSAADIPLCFLALYVWYEPFSQNEDHSFVAFLQHIHIKIDIYEMLFWT